MGSVNSDTPFFISNLYFTGVQNKMSIVLPFWYNVSDQTHKIHQGDNAREHYTLFTSNHSTALSTKLLVIKFYLQIYPSQAMGF